MKPDLSFGVGELDFELLAGEFFALQLRTHAGKLGLEIAHLPKRNSISW